MKNLGLLTQMMRMDWGWIEGGLERKDDETNGKQKRLWEYEQVERKLGKRIQMAGRRRQSGNMN